MKSLKVLAAAAALLLSPVGQVLADGYWTYAYQDFDVVTGDGGGERAIALARDVARFHEALAQILNVPDRPLPTHIYELPHKVLKPLIGEGGYAYIFDGYETTVLSDSSAAWNNRDKGALFGYTGSFLLSGGFARSSHWFLTGVPELFADTRFEPERLEMGSGATGFWVLSRARRIPMRVFLRIQGSDPQLRSSPFDSNYFFESWYLAREVLVEGKLRPEFGKYLSLIRAGSSEEDAFSASFKLSYEDLDKLLDHDVNEPAHVLVVKVPQAPADNAQARELSSAEADARLAELSFAWGHYADALRIASHVLQQEPTHELALRILAREKLREGDFGAALAAVDKLSALASLTAPGLTDAGAVLSQLARAVSSSQASLSADAASLHVRAQAAFERAINLDPEYLRAWAGLADLYNTPASAAEARALVARAQPVMEKHSYSGPLARALAGLCARTGQMQCAFLFGEFWKGDAVTERDLDQASAFLARMQTR